MDRVFDYKLQRRLVGLIALFLGPGLSFLSLSPLPSISASYWTDVGPVFVGALCAVSVFLFSYNGTGAVRDAEYWLAKASGALALVVAFFPTAGDAEPPRWTQAVASLVSLEPSHLHYAAAVLLFGNLTAMMAFFARRAWRKTQRARSVEYALIASLMLLGLVGGIAMWLFELGAGTPLLFWLEFWMLACFGIGWFRAGWYKEQDLAGTPAAG